MKRIIMVLVTVLAPMFAIEGCSMSDEVTIVTIHNNGESTDYTADNSDIEKLIGLCEQRISTSNNILRLAVSKTYIDGIRKHGLSIEINYKQPHVFNISFFNNRKVAPTRILIPLSGDLSGEFTTIFLGFPDYAHGPYRSPYGTSDLLEAVEQAQSSHFR